MGSPSDATTTRGTKLYMQHVMFFFFAFCPWFPRARARQFIAQSNRRRDNAQSESSHNFTYKYVPSSLMLILANFVEWTMPFAVWIASSFLVCRNVFFSCGERTFLHHVQGSITVDIVHPVLRRCDRFWSLDACTSSIGE